MPVPVHMLIARTLGGALCLWVGAALAQDEAMPSGAESALSQLPVQSSPQPAESVDPGQGFGAIVVLNQERLLAASLYGQRIQREVEAAGAALAAENRRIEQQLTEEELRLTEQRATMSAEGFRPLAEDFDARVEGIRAAQEAKARALQAQAEAAQARFFELAFPILIELVQARGASVLMDNRAVLLSVEGADITDAAIDLINTRIGDGDDAPLIDLDGTAPGPSDTTP
jgi:Skp family chaperone for outer membrane proteins